MTINEIKEKKSTLEKKIEDFRSFLDNAIQELKELHNQCTHPGITAEPVIYGGTAVFHCPYCGYRDREE